MRFSGLAKGIVTMGLVLCTGLVNGQDRPRRTPEQRAENQTRWMQKNLGLTKEQNDKVYDIILYYAREADKANMDAPGREKKIEKQGIRKDREGELRAVLNTEQYQRLQQHEQEMKAKKMERQQMN